MNPRSLGNFVFLAELVAIVGVAALFLFGVVGEVGLWRVIAFVTLANFAMLARLNRGLIKMIDRGSATLETATAIIEAATITPTVRCAGCRTAAVLAGGMTETEAGEPGMVMPPGWEMSNDRPYCGSCLAK